MTPRFRLVAGLALLGLVLLTSPAHALTCANQHAKLLDAAAANTNGTWVFVSGCSKFSIHVSGITDATVTINIANTPSAPSDATHHIQLDTKTSDSVVFLDGPVMWIKARVTGYVGGTIYAYLEAQE